MYKRLDATTILRLADGFSIPMSEDNTDYQTFLAWLAEGNTLEDSAADPPAKEV